MRSIDAAPARCEGTTLSSPLIRRSIIALSEATKSYGADDALRRVSLAVEPGEIFGVIGESGAGKSTLLRLITGETPPTHGEVRVLGESVPDLSRAGLRQLRRSIGVVFQGVHLLHNRTVAENVLLPLQIERAGPRGRSRRQEDSRRVAEMLAFVGLDGHAARFPAQLSGGQQQRVAIARALVGRPDLLLCDEPTSSLDATTADGVLGVLADARDRLGTTVVVVTHDLEVVRAICDRVALFERGELRETLTVDAVRVAADESYLDRARRALGA